MTQIPPAERVEFGPFSLFPGERLLTHDGAPVEIGGRSFDLLAALVEQPGRVVSKRDLLKRVWPDVIVEDGSLRFHMAGLRRILGDGRDGARYISTQVGVGYAFVAPTNVVPRPDPVPTASRPVPPPTAGSLPARVPRLFGRETDVGLLVDRMATARLFTVVGPAGVGKTTLAIEIGHALLGRFADKVRFVDLGALGDPALLPSAIAGALGIVVQADDPMAVVLGHIRNRELLLVLDNCEHLIDAVSTTAERIGDAAAGVSILATSREPLRVRGEHVHWLGSLDYPDEAGDLSCEQLLAYPAVALFVERATAGNSALTLTLEEVRLVAAMCRRLDGMALPIELAAVRVAAHGLQATSNLLGERLSLGWSGRRTALPRQQTLHATLDWSYQLLSEVQRRTLERLSVFLGPFSIAAAMSVAAGDGLDPDEVAAALDELTAKSLVSPDRWGEPGFYRLVEITRSYAQEKLAARGFEEGNSAARRHALRYLQELEKVHDGIYLGRAPRFALHLSAIRSALSWAFGPDGDSSLAVPLAAICAPVFLELSLLGECRAWCARAVEQLDESRRDTATEVELQAALGLSLMFTRGNSEAAEAALRRALDVAVALGDCRNQLRLLGRLHIFHERIGDFGTARAWADMAVGVAASIGEPEAVGVAASLSGISSHLAGEHQRARGELELSLANCPNSDRSRTAYYGFDHRNRSAIALARTLWLQGSPGEAKGMASRTVCDAAGLDVPATYCIALIWALSVDLWTGDPEQAEADLLKFTACAELNAFGPYIAAAGGFRGELAVHQGRAGEALGLIEESLARLHAARYELLTTSFEIALVQGLASTGRDREALELAESAIARCTANGELFAMPELLRVKASVTARLAREAEAVALLHKSLELSGRQGAKGWELRAATDLATLLTNDRRPKEAAAILGPIRASFGNEFESADIGAADRVLRRVAEANSKSRDPAK